MSNRHFPYQHSFDIGDPNASGLPAAAHPRPQPQRQHQIQHQRQPQAAVVQPAGAPIIAPRIVVITGGTLGLGRETAIRFAQEGRSLGGVYGHRFHILIGSRTMQSALDAIRYIARTVQIDAGIFTPFVIDMAKDQSITEARDFIQRRFRYIDILINNVRHWRGADWETLTSRERIHQVFDVEAFGVIEVTEAFLPLIRASDHNDRRIVNVSSPYGHISAALNGRSGIAAHFEPLLSHRTSKCALNMITAVYAAKLLAEGILVVVAEPAPMARRRNLDELKHLQGADCVFRAAVEGPTLRMWGRVVDDSNILRDFGW